MRRSGQRWLGFLDRSACRGGSIGRLSVRFFRPFFRSFFGPILTSHFGVLIGRRDLGLGRIASGLEKGSQVVPAPATASPGSETFRQLTDSLRFFQANELLDLATRDMEAQADFLVQRRAFVGWIHNRGFSRVLCWTVESCFLPQRGQ